MDAEATVVPPGEGLRVGNVEFLALSEDTPRFNLSIITVAPNRHGRPAVVNIHAPAGFDRRLRSDAG